jgi:hypothetical protein
MQKKKTIFFSGPQEAHKHIVQLKCRAVYAEDVGEHSPLKD